MRQLSSTATPGWTSPSLQKVAAALNITARYVGEEPASQVTGLYNQIMKEQLPKAGIHCIIVPRKQAGGKPSVPPPSASASRTAIGSP